jgi:outer membrane protein TolC
MPRLGFLLLFLVAATAPAQARPLGLEEALRLAEGHVSTLRSKQADVERADSLYASVLATFGPRVSLNGVYQHWDRELSFPTQLLDDNGAPTGEVVDNVVRRRDTWSAGLSVQQPLTPLLTTWLASRAAAAGRDQATQGALRERSWVRLRVHEAYYAAIAAERTAASLATMEQAVAEHLRQVEQFVDMRILKRDELLRTQVQMLSVQRERAAADMGLKLAWSGLALLVGDPLTTEYTLTLDGEAPPPDTPEACEAIALRERADLLAARAAVEAARAARDQRYMEWVPQIGALFSYSHSSASTLASADSWYVGASLDWPIWEWGRSYYGLKAAEAEVRKAEEGLRQAEDGVRFEVRQAWLSAWRAGTEIERAKQAAAQAHENLQIQETLFREKLTTTIVVIDAQSMAMTTEMQQAVAETSLRIALHQLAAAMGR